MSFSLHHKSVAIEPTYEYPEVPNIIEGAAELDVLCPVSRVTGNRENPISLLTKLQDDAMARQLSIVLQELPVNNAPSGMSDKDLADLVIPRLATGTPAEDDRIRDFLMSVADVVFPSSEMAKSEVQSPDDKSEVVAPSAVTPDNV